MSNPQLIPLYTVDTTMIKTSLRNLELFMLHREYLEGITYTYEEGKYIVLHCPETGDMCHLYNHPKILRAVLDYNITCEIDYIPLADDEQDYICPYCGNAIKANQQHTGNFQGKDFGTWSRK